MFKCEYCHTIVKNSMVFGLVLRGQKFLKVCPTCYKMIHNKEVEQMEISKKDLQHGGFLSLGWDKRDIKEYLKRWAIKETQKF